ncbi:MAG: hypothetical protein LBP87_06295, partial [Planctomycetaceae bacterium]|nr:hypothetical protein [Planctomycetaceae bacterium]
AILFRDDVVTFNLNLPENNPLALEEVRKYIELSTLQNNKEINLYDACYNRFSEQPYGWLEVETALLFVQLYAAGEINFIIGGDIPNRNVLNNALTDTKKWQSISIVQKKAINPETLKNARELGRSLFAAMGPSAEDDLYKFLRTELENRQKQLKDFTDQVANGQYPGKKIIDEFNSIVSDMLRFNENESQRFFQKFNERREYLQQLNEKYQDICNFLTDQKSIWDNMLKKMPELKQNQRQLEKDNESIKNAFKQLDAIKVSEEPYSMIREIPALLNTITAENNKLLEQYRNKSIENIAQIVESINKNINLNGVLESVDQSIKIATETGKILCDTYVEAVDQVTAVTNSVNLKGIGETVQSVLSQIPTMKSVAEIIVAEKDAIKDIEKIKDTLSKSKTIHPADFLTKPYLETKIDIDEFLNKLRNEMENAINNNERIKIQ